VKRCDSVTCMTVRFRVILAGCTAEQWEGTSCWVNTDPLPIPSHIRVFLPPLMKLFAVHISSIHFPS